MSSENVERVLAGRVCIDMTRILVEYQLKVPFLPRMLELPTFRCRGEPEAVAHRHVPELLVS
jgi:hypothetical protein